MATRRPPQSDSQLELFSAVFTDVLTRDTQDTMAVPFLSLSKRPRFEPIEYRDANRGIEVTVAGGRPWGIATIWDWDLIMWLLSQIRHAIDRGEEVSPRVRFHRHAFLRDARRSTGGAQYRRLEEAITRLKNTHVHTTIRAANGKTEMFSWIERATIERDGKDRIAYAVVQLPDWLFRAVRNQRLILSLHRDYFLLTGGLERWLYRFIRKAAGTNSRGWEWTFRTLHKRSGSTQRFGDFSRDLRRRAARGRLLDYELTETTRPETRQAYLRAKRMRRKARADVVATVDEKLLQFVPAMDRKLALEPDVYEKAKRLAPGYDVYALESDWREATERNGIDVKNPGAAFLAWCKAVNARTPIAR